MTPISLIMVVPVSFSSLPATNPAVKGGANRGSSNISNSNNCPAGASSSSERN